MSYGTEDAEDAIRKSRSRRAFDELIDKFPVANTAMEIEDLMDSNTSRRTKRLAREALKAMDRLNASIQADIKFGAEPPEGSVVRWTRRFTSSRSDRDWETFDYAALRVKDLWYLTDKGSFSYKWDRLIEAHLRYAHGQVLVARTWNVLVDVEDAEDIESD